MNEKIGDKKLSLFQTSKRNDFNAVRSSISHLSSCQDNQEIWLPQGDLYLLFVVFLDEPI